MKIAGCKQKLKKALAFTNQPLTFAGHPRIALYDDDEKNISTLAAQAPQ
jgi:hypothetical protein